SVAWSTDGSRLLAGGQLLNEGRHIIRTWDAQGRRLGADRAVAGGTIMSLAPCGDAIAFGAADPSFGLLPPRGAAVTLGQGQAPVMRGKVGDAFTVSADGTRVRFGLGYRATSPVSFDLAVGALEESLKIEPDLRRPDVTGLKISDWEDTTSPTLD